MKSLTTQVTLATFLLVVCCAGLAPYSVRGTKTASATEEASIYDPPIALPLKAPRILVKKAERRMFLYEQNKVVRTYRIGLGLSPVGDKVRQGDRRTPEGDFYIFTKNDRSQFYLSLGISYPNEKHATRGLRDGLISRNQYDSIMRALRGRKAPPQNTALGGDIYIHGRGASSDWTWGCVALEDEDMRELFNAVAIGTPVTVRP